MNARIKWKWNPSTGKWDSQKNRKNPAACRPNSCLAYSWPHWRRHFGDTSGHCDRCVKVCTEDGFVSFPACERNQPPVEEWRRSVWDNGRILLPRGKPHRDSCPRQVQFGPFSLGAYLSAIWWRGLLPCRLRRAVLGRFGRPSERGRPTVMVYEFWKIGGRNEQENQEKAAQEGAGRIAWCLWRIWGNVGAYIPWGKARFGRRLCRSERSILCRVPALYGGYERHHDAQWPADQQLFGVAPYEPKKPTAW